MLPSSVPPLLAEPWRRQPLSRRPRPDRRLGVDDDEDIDMTPISELLGLGLCSPTRTYEPSPVETTAGISVGNGGSGFDREGSG